MYTIVLCINVNASVFTVTGSINFEILFQIFMKYQILLSSLYYYTANTQSGPGMGGGVGFLEDLRTPLLQKCRLSSETNKGYRWCKTKHNAIRIMPEQHFFFENHISPGVSFDRQLCHSSKDLTYGTDIKCFAKVLNFQIYNKIFFRIINGIWYNFTNPSLLNKLCIMNACRHMVV